MKSNELKYAQRVGRAVIAAFNLSLHWLTLTLVGTAAGAAHAMVCAGNSAHGLAFHTGASPAGVQSGQAPQAAQVIHYNAKFTQNLKANTPAQRVCTRRPMPLNAGQQYMDFMYQQLGTYTGEATEGTVGSSLSIGVSSRTFTIGQWADFINFSDLVLSTTIDPMLENVEKELAYSLGRTIQLLTLVQLDSGRAIDSRVGSNDATSATQTMTRVTGTAAVGGLRGANVLPLEGNTRFGGLIHPFFTTDMMIDQSVGSYTDILKHTPEGTMALKELPSPADSEEADVISFGGVTWLETTQLTQTPNWTPAGSNTPSGATAIRTYIVGNDGVLAVRLERPGKTSIGDGRYQNLKLWRGTYAAGSSFDPAGQIGGGTSYNVTGTWGLPPDTTCRFRAYDFVPQHT